MSRGAFDGGTSMKRLMISALAAAALLAATTATAMLYFPSPEVSAGTAMPSLHELHVAAAANKLPTEDVEDMSLVYSTVTASAK